MIAIRIDFFFVFYSIYDAACMSSKSSEKNAGSSIKWQVERKE